MKKLLSGLLILVLCTNLCGCVFKEAVSGENNSYIVTAIGIDGENGELSLSVEALVINSEESDSEKELVLLKGKGKSLNEAIGSCLKKAVEPLMFSHMGVIALGEGLSEEYFKEIISFCREKSEIPLLCYLVATENARKLLSLKPISSATVGYDIMSMLSRTETEQGIAFKSRLFEINSLSEKPLEIFSLPLFETEEKSFFIGGALVYEKYTPSFSVDISDMAFFALATDTLSKGEIYLTDELYNIKSAYSQLEIKNSKTARLIIDLRTDGEKQTFKKGIEELFEASKEKGTDIFMIGNTIYAKNRELWQEIKSDYKEFYKNLSLSVELK